LSTCTALPHADGGVVGRGGEQRAVRAPRARLHRAVVPVHRAHLLPRVGVPDAHQGLT